MIIADLLEASKMANVYQSSKSRRPCYSCLTSRNDLNNIDLTSISPRTHDNMKEAINNDDEQNYSIHPEKNAFWEIRYEINIFFSII